MNIRSCIWLALCFSAGAAAAQTTPVAPAIHLGTTLPALNSPAAIQVLVTDPALAQVPTGTVTIDFGDGTPPAAIPLATTVTATTHSYATLGQFTIQASYSGDTNFSPASASVTTVSVPTAPVYTLYTIGDSITGASPTNWPYLLSTALGWPRVDYAEGGFRTQDESPAIYRSKVDASYASTWLLGQNDGQNIDNGGQAQFEHAVLAENAWMAIPEGPAKLRAQNAAVVQSGDWSASDIYPTTGLRSSTAGSSLTATLPGSTLYLGLTSLVTTDYTIDVIIDGVDQGPLSPVSTYSGKAFDGEPFGARYPVGGSQTATHTVTIVCVDPGTSGCYVDWIGGNGVARPNTPPYVFTGVSYTTRQSYSPASFQLRQGIVRAVESELESDGLAIRLADLAADFSGPELPECLVDAIHPGPCGASVLEAAWLSSMTYLATEAQRIDATPASAVVGVPLALESTATSGMPVSLQLISGPGQLTGNQLTATAKGAIVVEANQPGDSTVLPAAPVQINVAVPGVPLTVTALDAAHAYGSANPAFGYTITGFAMGDTQSSAVSGTPLLSTAATAASGSGQYAITPSLGTLASTKYSFTAFVPGTLTITDVGLTVTALSASQVYGSADPAFDYTITGFVNGDTQSSAVSGAPVFNTTATAVPAVGRYPVTPTLGTLASANYAFSKFVAGSLTVTPHPLTVTALNASQVYGDATPGLGYTMTGFVNGDTQSSAVTGAPALRTPATAASAAGQYPIVPAKGTLASANYAFPDFVNGTLAITARPLTVTALNASRVFGAANPAFAVAITGFVNGDTQSSALSGVPAFSTTATANSPAGQYPITVATGTLASPNYTFPTFVAGMLTISDYTLAANTSALTIPSGQSESVALTLTPLFGYQGSVALTCNPVPAYVTCTANPATLVADGSGTPLQATLTISSPAASVATLRRPGVGSGPGISSGSGSQPVALLGLPALIAGLLLFSQFLFSQRRRLAVTTLFPVRIARAAVLVTLLTSLAGVMSCGSGSHQPSTPTVQTTLITVTGTAPGATPLAHTVQVKVTVN